MRTMGDSTTASDIPQSVDMVAGYINGSYKWTDADWALFPGKPQVRIAVNAQTNDGNCLDVEAGDAFPDEAPKWVLRRRAAGVDPTVYCSYNAWPIVRAAFATQQVAEPHYWIAAYDNNPTIYEGAVAKQYANDDILGGHYDLSSVADYWPGVDTGMTKDEVIALLAEYGIDKFKVPALVKEFETHVHATPPNLSGGPIVPPFDGATYFGASADMKEIGWNDPKTGKTRYFTNGVEVAQ